MIHADLPLIDLHRHLDGNVRLGTILELAQQHQLPLPADTLEALRPHIQVNEPLSDIGAYFQKFTWMVSIFADVNACRRVAYENVLDAHAEGIDYIELRFSPWFMAEPHGLDPTGVVHAVVDGVRSAVGTLDDIQVNLIGIISRTYGVEIGHKELDALLTCKDDIIGLDLAGDEANFPAAWFIPHFNRARDVGWGITVHAGESAGTQSVWQAIRDLGASRIGHAVCILEDPALVDHMLEARIGIEANLTSNWHTNTVPSYAEHPLKAWLDLGLLATINTDDPGISPITLREEFEMAAPAAGLTVEDTRKAQQNAVEVAFLPAAEKQALLQKKVSGAQLSST
ncbi:MAG: adenosine deaminase [Chloroflexi bacterium]|nr:adenosine deaminase [Chloroflexota bacterium]